MSVEFKKSVPVPTLVRTEEEAWDLLHLLLLKHSMYPDEPFGFDTETTGKKIPIKEGKSPLDWMSDYVTYWSVSARMDREIYNDWVAYLEKWHPEHFTDRAGNPREPEQYARWCLYGEHLHCFIGFLENPDVILWLWNAKYDAHVCWNSRIDIWNAKSQDLLVAGYLLDENLQGKMSLKDRAYDWCGLHMTKFKDLFKGEIDPNTGKPVKEFETDLRVLPQDKVADYASYDAYATLKVGEFLEERLNQIPLGNRLVHQRAEQQGLEEGARTLWNHFLGIEVPMTKVLWRMERRGLPIDLGQLQATGPKILTEIDEVSRAINKETGYEMNINSPAQIARYFFAAEPDGLGLEPIKMTKGGQKGPQPSTDKEVLETLAIDGYTVAKKILRVRSLGKMYGTYVSNLRAMAEYFEDGRIHPGFNQYGARTGRFSTNDPNSQNFPRPGGDEFGIRKMFICRPGHKLIVADYEQLEMRIMAHFSRDRNMIGAIAEGKDLHCFTVSMMYNIPYEEVLAAKKAEEPDERQKWLKELRQHAKAIGFGLIYGAGPKKIASQLEITKAEAEDKIDSYFDAFPGVLEFIEKTHFECRESIRGENFVTTLAGRLRRLPQITHSAFLQRSHAEREAVNSIIQGTAADITKCAMLNIEFDPVLNSCAVWMLNQIHDELVMEVPEDNCQEVIPIITEYMERPLYGKQALVVPTPIDLKVVDNWAEAK